MVCLVAKRLKLCKKGNIKNGYNKTDIYVCSRSRFDCEGSRLAY